MLAWAEQGPCQGKRRGHLAWQLAPCRLSIPVDCQYCRCSDPPLLSVPLLSPNRQREQEDAHDFLEFMVDRLHSELAALGGADGASDAAVAAASPAAAAAAANAAKAAAEDEWLTKSGRRLTKRKQLRGDGETAVSALFRGTYVRCVGVGAG